MTISHEDPGGTERGRHDKEPSEEREFWEVWSEERAQQTQPGHDGGPPPVSSGAPEGAPAPARWIVVSAEPVTSVDVTAADVLVDLDEALRAKDIELLFAELKDPVKDKLKRFGLFSRFGENAFFATLEEAVNAFNAGRPDDERGTRIADRH